MNTYDNRDLIKICSKNDVVLQKNKINKNFIINFFIENKNIDISKVIDFSIYKLIGELNQDVLENIEINGLRNLFGKLYFKSMDRIHGNTNRTRVFLKR